MKLPSLRSSGDEGFDDEGEFVPEHLPDPGEFLAAHDVLTGPDHVAVHDVARAVFEARGVYDVTFGYNLARLNLDQRHPDAGFRYAESTDESGVLLAEFTPTTEFCPQSDTLGKGAFRAWNGLADRHDYDLVRVRVDPMHHRSEHINAELRAMETEFEETGAVPDPRAVEASGPDGSGDDEVPDVPF